MKVEESRKDSEKERKDTFLLEMYKEQFKHIDRHVNLSWQSISIIFIFGVLSTATYRFGLDPFITSILTILATSWNFARLYDSNHWYERHIHIVSNIECHFLKKSDEKDIHCYFKEVRNSSNSLEWITLQKVGLSVIWVLSILFYVITVNSHSKILKELNFVFSFGEFIIITLVSVFLIFLLDCYKKHNDIEINRLRQKSPGKGRVFDDKNARNKLEIHCNIKIICVKIKQFKKHCISFFK